MKGSGKVLEDVRREAGTFCVCSLAEMKVKSLLSHRDWKIVIVSFLMVTFQKDGSQVHEKDIAGLQN